MRWCCRSREGGRGLNGGVATERAWPAGKESRQAPPFRRPLFPCPGSGVGPLSQTTLGREEEEEQEQRRAGAGPLRS